GEDPLDADAVRDLADGERRPRALRHAPDAHPFEGLQARLLAFTNLRPDLDRITRAELGKRGLTMLTLFDRVENPLSTHDGVHSSGLNDRWDVGSTGESTRSSRRTAEESVEQNRAGRANRQVI